MKFWQVDAFTKEAFKGNPAAVFILNKDIEKGFKQSIAMEMNLSETVFVVLGEENHISWFTPAKEVNLCGHATIAAGHILWTQGFIKEEKIAFTSNSGPLYMTKEENESYTLDFPKQEGAEKPEYTKTIEEIIGIKAINILSNNEDVMAVVKSSQFLKKLKPNLDAIKNLLERGFLVTSIDDEKKYDYIYRAFFPKLDVPEDPVTGSANTILAPYWAKKLNKNKLLALQASKREGILVLEVLEKRVLITGSAITIFEGTWLTF